MNVLKVSSKTKVSSLAGAIAETVRENGSATLSAMGAGAVNQAVKAIATAKGFLSPSGIEIVCSPAFDVTRTNDAARTRITIVVRKEQ